MVFDKMLVIYDPKSVRLELNDIKYFLAIGFIQFCFVPNIYIIKLIWNELDYVFEFDQLVNSDIIGICQRIMKSNIEKFIEKIDCPILFFIEIQSKLFF